MRLPLIAVLLVLTALPALVQAAVPPRVATFSVAAYDPRTGEVGVAVQSKFFAVGSIVPHAKAGVGAVATQAYADPRFGPRGLELLELGENPTATLLALLGHSEDGAATAAELDPNAAQRQVGLVSVRGTQPIGGAAAVGSEADQPLQTGEQTGKYRWVAGRSGQATTYTGGECMDWAGGIVRVAPDGVVYAVQGNILTGPEVVAAMARYMDDPTDLVVETVVNPLSLDAEVEILKAIAPDDFASRLLGALVAGQLAGGDSRGMQSAALIVEQPGAGYGGYTDLKYDLRVDDAEDPFHELARLLNKARPIQTMFQAYNLLSAGEHVRAVELFRELTELEPLNANHRYNLACGLSVLGDSAAALEQLAQALELDPALRQAAQGDPDFANIRETDEFAALVGD